MIIVLGPLQAKHGIGAHLLGLEDDDLESFHPQLGNGRISTQKKTDKTQ